VVVTDSRHTLFGQTLDVDPVGSRRGPSWIAVLLPDGRRRHVRRVSTDLVRPPSDSKSPPLISAQVLVRVARLISALSGRSEEESHGPQQADDQAVTTAAAPVGRTAGGDAAASCLSDGTNAAGTTPSQPDRGAS